MALDVMLLANQGNIGMAFIGCEVFSPAHGFAARPVIDL